MAEKEKEKELPIEVAYIGEDDSFFLSLKNTYTESNKGREFIFHHFMAESSQKGNEVFHLIVEAQMKIVYIDFCKRAPELLYLAKFLSRDNLTKDIVLVGLFDNLTEEKVKQEAVLSGVTLNQIKGAEVQAAVYQPLELATGKAIIPDYAVAKLAQQVTAKEKIRVISVSETGMKVEMNQRFKVGDDVTIDTTFFSRNRKFSNKHKVAKVTKSGMRTPMDMGYECDFYFVNPPNYDDVATTDDTPEMIREKQADLKSEYEESLDGVRKSLGDWIKDVSENDLIEPIQAMVIDKKCSIYEQADKNIFYDYPYKVIPQSYLRFPEYEIEHYRPDLIAYQYEPLPRMNEEEKAEFKDAVNKVEEIKKNLTAKAQAKNEITGPTWEVPIREIRAGLFKLRATPNSEESKQKVAFALNSYTTKNRTNDLDGLKRIILGVKALESYEPIILIFNGMGLNVEKLREVFQYSQIMIQSNPFEFNQFKSMVQLFQKKQEAKQDKVLEAKVAALKKKDPQKFRKLSKMDLLGGSRVKMREKNENSVALIHRTINLTSASESEVTFKTEDNSWVEMGSVYTLEYPVKMDVTICPHKASEAEMKDGPRGHRAYIHTVGEIDKQKLRRFINKIFFADLDKEKAKDRAEFEAIQQAALASRNAKPAPADEGSSDDKGNDDDGDPSKEAG